MWTYIALIIVLLCLSTFAYAGISAAPWIPSWKSDVQRFLDIADIQPGNIVYDLGCGDGRILVAAAKAGAYAKGYEISILPYVIAKLRSLRYGEHMKVYYKSFWKADIHDADIVFVFLMPKTNQRLKHKLQQELRPGTKIVTYVWPFTDWQTDAINELKDKPKLRLYTV